jgi:hypothetical protein
MGWGKEKAGIVAVSFTSTSSPDEMMRKADDDVDPKKDLSSQLFTGTTLIQHADCKYFHTPLTVLWLVGHWTR